ncbi:hypothetical protein LTR08_002244 [Meristemomyces frigidus]|nr:hypothetical protein LTR08_002244 [Meristemomyces frigidus]
MPATRMKRYFTYYPRCCGRTWLAGVYFCDDVSSSSDNPPQTRTPPPAYSPGSPMDVDTTRTVAADDSDDIITTANEAAICYRCTDRLRLRCWRLGVELGEVGGLSSSVRAWEMGVEFERLPDDDESG